VSVNFINSGFFTRKSEYEKYKLTSKKFLTTNLTSAFDNTEEVVIFFNSQLNIIYANNSFLRLFNYTLNEIIGKNITNYFFLRNLSVEKKDFINEIQNHGENRIFLVRKNDGTSVKCYLKSTIFKYGFDKDLVIQLTGGKFQIEKSLFSRYLLDTSNLSTVLKSFVDYLFIIDNNGYILDFINSQIKKSINFDENPIGKKIQEVLPCDNQSKSRVIRSIFKAVLQNSKQEIEIYNPHLQKTYLLTINPSDESYFIVFIKDITNYKVSYEEKKNLELSLKNIWENSQDGLIILDSGGFIINVNSSFLMMFELNKKEALGKEFLDLFNLSECDKKKYFVEFENNFNNRTFANYQELELTIRNGKKKAFVVTYSFIELNENELPTSNNQTSLLCIFKDITESKIQAFELRQKEELYHNFINNSSEAILLTDLNGKIFDVNKKALELFKYDNTDEFVNQNIHDYIQPEQKSQIKILINKIVTQKISVQKELCLLGSGGVKFIGDMNASLLVNQENNPYALMIFIKDITEQKKMERELDNTKLLATMGKMTLFITHQIKTPLSAVKMNIDMLESRMEINENEKKSFEIISKEISRLSGLTKNILIYSKVTEPKFDKVDLSQVIESIRFLLNPLLDKKKITFINTLNTIEVDGDLVLLQSLFLQLIENSIEAIEQNGLIEISYQENKDDGLSIYIKDNGCGITDCKKIFEPFFTSKSAGTGLGIPIAVKILKQHNGALNIVSSRKGETIFELKLKKFLKKH
jgi:two-component system, sporulation sensor kinase E